MMQFGGGGDWISSILWFLMLFVFIFLYPRIMITQVVVKIEKDLNDIENMGDKGKEKILSKISKKPSKELKKKVSDFMEFFVATPVSLDPYGIVGKIHQVIKHAESREIGFVEEIAPNLSKEGT